MSFSNFVFPSFLENFKYILILLIVSVLAARLSYPLLHYIVFKIEQTLGPLFKDKMIKLSRMPYALLIFCLIWYKALPFVFTEVKWLEFFTQPLYVIVGYSLVAISYQIIDVLSLYIEMLLKNDNGTDSLHKNLLPYSRKMLKIAVTAVVIIIILQNVGLNVSSLIASLGIGGLAIALGAKDTLGNLFGGFSIIVDKPFAVGDWIVCQKFEGTVEDIGFRSTKIKTFYDSVITLPNSLIADSVVDNLGRRKARRARFNLDITYDTSAEEIESFIEGIKNILRVNNFVRQDYFQVYFSGYANSSLQIFINLFLKVSDWDSELLQKQNIFLEILKLSKQLNISFAFPTQTLDVPSLPQATQKPEKQSLNASDLKKISQSFSK